MIRSYKNVGRKPIDEKYIFNEDKYLRIIAFMFTCKRFNKEPRMLELQHELVENHKITNENKKKINDFFKLETYKEKDQEKKKEAEEEKKDWKKGINVIKDVISDEEVYKYALKMSEWGLSDISYSFFDTLRSLKIYEQLADNKITKIEGERKLSQVLKDNNKSHSKVFPDKYTLFKYIKYLKKTGLINCSNAKRNKTYFLTPKGYESIDRRLIGFKRFDLKKDLESASDEVIRKNYPEIKRLLNER